jgi:type I restriction enzyme S subunit
MKSGWKTSCLGDVLATIKNGLNCKQDKSGVGQRISRIESISQASFDLSRVGYAEISDSEKSKFRLIKGDILFSHINSPIHVGKTAVFDADEDVYHGVNLLLMRPTAEISSAYLELFLKYLFDTGYWRSTCKQSVNQASVNQQDISRVPIAFPASHTEQQRIVAILDEAFEGIATAKANAERNLRNTREVFASHLEQVLSRRQSHWGDIKLGALCQVKTGKKDVNEGNPEGQFPFFTCAAEHTYSDSFSFDTEALLIAGNGNVGHVNYYSGKFEAYQRTYVLSGFNGVQARYLFRVLDKRLSATMNEAETRAEHIDPALKAAGWGVVEGSRILREHGITQGRLQGGGKRAKAEIADYVLVYRNTKLARSRPRPGTSPTPRAWARPRTTPPSWRCALPTPPTGKRSTAST